MLPDPWYGPETTCEETFGTHGVACISGRNTSSVGSVGFWGAKRDDDMDKHERKREAREVHTPGVEVRNGSGSGIDDDSIIASSAIALSALLRFRRRM